MGILAQYTHIANHHAVCLKYITVLFVNHTSVKLGKEKSHTRSPGSQARLLLWCLLGDLTLALGLATTVEDLPPAGVCGVVVWSTCSSSWPSHTAPRPCESQEPPQTPRQRPLQVPGCRLSHSGQIRIRPSGTQPLESEGHRRERMLSSGNICLSRKLIFPQITPPRPKKSFSACQVLHQCAEYKSGLGRLSSVAVGRF